MKPITRRETLRRSGAVVVAGAAALAVGSAAFARAEPPAARGATFEQMLVYIAWLDRELWNAAYENGQVTEHGIYVSTRREVTRFFHEEPFASGRAVKVFRAVGMPVEEIA